MAEIKIVQTTPNELESLIKESVKTELETIKKDLSNQEEKDKILTREETAKLLDIDLSSLYRWTKKGKIKAHGIANRVYYYLSDINQALLPIN